MDPIKQKKLKKAMKRNINSRIAISWLFTLIIVPTIYLGIAIFFPTEKNNKELIITMYIMIAISLLVVLIMRFWPRKFDDRELKLYDEYLKNLKNLKITIEKEKIETDYKDRIKELEEENTYQPQENDMK